MNELSKHSDSSNIKWMENFTLANWSKFIIPFNSFSLAFCHYLNLLINRLIFDERRENFVLERIFSKGIENMSNERKTISVVVGGTGSNRGGNDLLRRWCLRSPWSISSSTEPLLGRRFCGCLCFTYQSPGASLPG